MLSPARISKWTQQRNVNWMRCVNVETAKTAKTQNVPIQMNGVCVVVVGGEGKQTFAGGRRGCGVGCYTKNTRWRITPMWVGL